MLTTLAYRRAFFDGDIGHGRGAVACVMSLFGLCATALYLRLQSRGRCANRHDRYAMGQDARLDPDRRCGIRVAAADRAGGTRCASRRRRRSTRARSASPAVVQWENFSSAWRNASLGSSLLHSAQVAALTILMVCATAAPAPHVLARQKGCAAGGILTFYFMASITCASSSSICIRSTSCTPSMGLVNSIPAVSADHTAMFSPFAIFLLRTYVAFNSLCAGGSGPGRPARKPGRPSSMSVLPMMRLGLLTVAIIVSLNAWNEFVIAVTFLQNDSNVTAIVEFL